MKGFELRPDVQEPTVQSLSGLSKLLDRLYNEPWVEVLEQDQGGEHDSW